MVVFTCNHCGETLHKPKVEKHYQFQCRNYKSVSCVDCFKDFRDEEYVVHTKCITEDERYAAKGTYKNGIVKKGEVKQESWLETIRSICNSEKNLKPSLRNLLNTISGYSNVPRKKVKFLNFIKSSSGGRVNMNDVEEVWNIIEKYKANNSNQKSEQSNNKTDKTKEAESKKRPNEDCDSEVKNIKKKKTNLDNGDKSDIEPRENGENIKKKKKKQNNSENEIDIEISTDKVIEQSNNNEGTFDFKQKILEIVTSKGEISLKKLQKKVLKSYAAFKNSECDEKAIRKFSKKLKKIPTVKLENEKVVFISV